MVQKNKDVVLVESIALWLAQITRNLCTLYNGHPEIIPPSKRLRLAYTDW
jgi:hypothetical protein